MNEDTRSELESRPHRRVDAGSVSLCESRTEAVKKKIKWTHWRS